MSYCVPRIYISESKHPKAVRIFRKWKDEDRNISDMICRAIEVFGEEGGRYAGRASYLDHYVEEERWRREADSRIDNFMLMVNEWRESPKALFELYTPDQMRKLNSACMILHYKLEEALTLNAGR